MAHPLTTSKFGIPMGGGSGRGGLLQPKFQNRFRVRFVSFGPLTGGLDLTQQVETIAKPTVRYAPIEIHSYNSRAYFSGKHEWEELSLTIKDDITNTATVLIGHQIQKQMNHYEQTAFAAGSNYKFLTYIETMDGGNDTVLDAWTLEGCMISSAKFSELDYKANDMQRITISIRFDNATMDTALMTDTPDYTYGVRVD